MRTYPQVFPSSMKRKIIKKSTSLDFSGAVETAPEFENGDILAIHSASEEFRYAYCNKRNFILVG